MESCFQIAYSAWSEVKQNLTSYQFKNDQCEIEFFKDLKPLFTSEILYYELLYHAVVFEPPGIICAIQFWQRESLRLHKFEQENKTFLLCYADQSCNLIPYYFLSRYTQINGREIKLYDAGGKYLTKGDGLVATVRSLRRYMNYVDEKKEQLLIIIKSRRTYLIVYLARSLTLPGQYDVAMTKRAIALAEFEQLSLMEKLDILHQDGVHVGKRVLKERRVMLYQLTDFYVEVYFLHYRKEVERIITTKDVEITQPYLNQVQVRDLDVNKEE